MKREKGGGGCSNDLLQIRRMNFFSDVFSNTSINFSNEFTRGKFCGTRKVLGIS